MLSFRITSLTDLGSVEYVRYCSDLKNLTAQGLNVSEFPSNIRSNYLAGYRCISDATREGFTALFSIFATAGITGNIVVLSYILWHRLFKNFVSTHFIAHLLFANTLCCFYLIPIFLRNLHDGADMFGGNQYCRVHGFLSVCILTVIYYMITCIAGVHLLTFARIHYDQLFGLPPSIICGVSWIIGASLGLPCLTNSSIIRYDPLVFQCVWADNQSSYKFYAYMILLGISLPVWLTIYAYMRILAIFYHSPLVFEALGLFRSRYLVFGFILNILAPTPFYITSAIPFSIRATWDPAILPVLAFAVFNIATASSILYGVSLFLMKEDDIALTSAAHKAAVCLSPHQGATGEV